MTGINLAPEFTTPNVVKSDEIVGFDGMESRITLNQGVKFSASRQSRTQLPDLHVELRRRISGSLRLRTGLAGSELAGSDPLPRAVALAVCRQRLPLLSIRRHLQRDADGHRRGRQHGDDQPRNHRAGSAAPRSRRLSSGGGSGSSASTQTQGASGSSPGSSAPGIVAPVAAAAILPQKLKRALRKGLVVSYSVNEQVAGRFEVLLSSAIAHRLGISGTPATGLPAGSAAEVMIAKAILVTTKGGRGAVHIKFSKSTAARLARAKQVPLTLRMIVHNAASSNPATSTVVSAVTLTG